MVLATNLPFQFIQYSPNADVLVANSVSVDRAGQTFSKMDTDQWPSIRPWTQDLGEIHSGERINR